VKPFVFEDLTLLIPELWDKPWATLIDEAGGVEKRFIIAQRRYAYLLRGVGAEPATPEKVGWLAIWSRLFGALTAGRAAADWESRFGVSIIARTAYESTLHLQAVMVPVLDGVEDGKSLSDEHWAVARDRLRGYVAWTLRGDELLYKHVLQQRNLDDAFNRKPEREFIRDLGDKQGAWERLSGQVLEVVSDQEAFQDRAKAVAFFRGELGRVAKWLSDRRLQPWRRSLGELEKTSNGSVSLFQLFGLGHGISSFLRTRGAGVGYYEYLRGSTFVHGSSLEGSMLTVEGLIAPDFADLGAGFQKAADRLLSHCQLHAVLLELLSNHLD
jgi:hypothetical protein